VPLIPVSHSRAWSIFCVADVIMSFPGSAAFSPNASRARRRLASGSSVGTSPSGESRRLNSTSRAGIEAASLPDTALGRVQPHLQSVEGQAPACLDYEFAVGDETPDG
jgi:hypothetical protein